MHLSLMRWMNLEPIIQSKLSQNKKNKYCILMHIYGIWKNGTNEPICRAGTEMQTQREILDTVRQRGGEGGRIERGALKHIPYHTY